MAPRGQSAPRVLSALQPTTSRGAIVGFVADSQFRVALRDARIIVVREGQSDDTLVTTTEEGGFRVEGLTPGSYTVVARQLGYKAQRLRVNVRSATTDTLQIWLQQNLVSSCDNYIR